MATAYTITTTVTAAGATLTRFFDAGILARITATFKDSNGTVQDPTVVKFDYRVNKGATTSLLYNTDAALVKSGTGIYYVDLDTTTSGRYEWDFYSTGTGTAAAHSDFYARPSASSEAVAVTTPLVVTLLLVHDSFTGDDTTVDFVLTSTPYSNTLQLISGTAYQNVTTDYTLSGKTVTFNSAPTLNTKINAWYYVST